ncbi:MAG: stage II sporulation protein M [Bacillota bacterium]|uniref:Stage II sporulation protein M n=1 Tax=Thermanaerosceptrum fracticalcis TaxID=1712410 RepID=A0A7G6E0F6_THEFR|nr:stage II sporulation protein M [Thermanaerosceptrum fracticalcis]QNB45560.1 stage II sporulation protein M [Thermanaerosceptrum fracticalcis]
MDKLKSKMTQHFRSSWWVYLFVLLCFTAGLIFGSLGVKALDSKQTSSLHQYLDNGLTQISEELNYAMNTKQAMLRNLYNLGKIFILGLTIIGLPLVLVIIFTRGFVLGFTIGFILQEKAWRGVVLALLAIVPPNILSLPAYILAGVTAINFSLYLIRGREGLRSQPISRGVLHYSIIMFGLSLFMLGAAFIEGYISPVFIRLLSLA